LSIFAEVFGYLLGRVYFLVQDYGIAIVLFTIMSKLILMPLTVKQMSSQKQMQDIQPKVAEIQKKYKDNPEKQNQMVMDLYKEHNYNPLSGCLPILIQFPIIIGLFTALREPATYVFVDNPELLAVATNQVFLWIPNLSLPDLMSNIVPNGPEWFIALPGLMPIISASLTYFQMKMTNNQQAQAAPQQGQQAMQMKIMQIIFPVMILFWGKSMSAGLILYWTVGNLFQIAQQYIMNRRNKGVA